MRTGPYAPILAACIALSIFARAGAAPTHPYYYLHSNDVDLRVLLPPPPDPSSAEEQADDKKVASIVANRTPAELVDALDESKRNVFFFAPSVGAGFAPEHLPLTTAFFDRIGSDVARFVGEAKSYWKRPRPGSGVRRIDGNRSGRNPAGEARPNISAGAPIRGESDRSRRALSNRYRSRLDDRNARDQRDDARQDLSPRL